MRVGLTLHGNLLSDEGARFARQLASNIPRYFLNSLFLSMQRLFIGGLTAGATKG